MDPYSRARDIHASHDLQEELVNARVALDLMTLTLNESEERCRSLVSKIVSLNDEIDRLKKRLKPKTKSQKPLPCHREKPKC